MPPASGFDLTLASLRASRGGPGNKQLSTAMKKEQIREDHGDEKTDRRNGSPETSRQEGMLRMIVISTSEVQTVELCNSTELKMRHIELVLPVSDDR